MIRILRPNGPNTFFLFCIPRLGLDSFSNRGTLYNVYFRNKFELFEKKSPCFNYMQYPWGYALPVSHIISTRESYPQYPWGYAVPMSHILSTREDMQYPWVISSVPMSHILSTREDMHYPWVIPSVPVSHILSTHEDMQYPWVISSVPVSHILSTRESYPQYPWGYAVPMSHIIVPRESYPRTREDMQYPWVNLYEWRVNETSLIGTAYPHRYCIPSRVLRIWLTGTEDMTHGYCISSRVLHILTGTEDMTHGYWWYESRVLHILSGTEDITHEYCIPSRVLRIWLTGNAYSLYRVKVIKSKEAFGKLLFLIMNSYFKNPVLW